MATFMLLPEFRILCLNPVFGLHRGNLHARHTCAKNCRDFSQVCCLRPRYGMCRVKTYMAEIAHKCCEEVHNALTIMWTHGVAEFSCGRISNCVPGKLSGFADVTRTLWFSCDQDKVGVAHSAVN